MKIIISLGTGTAELIGVVLVILKLLGQINWSWWWITLPFWGGFVLGIIIFLFIIFMYGALRLFNRVSNKLRSFQAD